MSEYERKYVQEIVKLSPKQLTTLSTNVYKEHDQGFRIVKVKGTGKEKKVTIKLKSGVTKVYTV